MRQLNIGNFRDFNSTNKVKTPNNYTSKVAQIFTIKHVININLQKDDRPNEALNYQTPNEYVA